MILIGMIVLAVLLFGALFGTVQKAMRWKLRRNRMRTVASTKIAVNLEDNSYKDLWELIQHISSGEIPVNLANVFESDGSNIVGLLNKDTTPKLDMSNGDTDSHPEIIWAASDSTAILFTVFIGNLDEDKDITIKFEAIMGGDTDTPTIASDVYCDRGDTKVEDVSGECGDAAATGTITVAHEDIPTGARWLTVELTPGAHTTDTLTMWDIRVANA